MPEEFWANALFSVIPTIVILAAFWFILRSIIRGDRTSRRVYSEIEAEERRKAGLPPVEPKRQADPTS